LKQWSHRDGPDEFQDSRDVLLNPMIFELDPGAEQIVRKSSD
jgi:P pilus assembly chaperone PapD